jgi:hypothetical protein
MTGNQCCWLKFLEASTAPLQTAAAGGGAVQSAKLLLAKCWAQIQLVKDLIFSPFSSFTLESGVNQSMLTTENKSKQEK